ncbi:hypothetical protein ON010_g8038 [Phytophthora cinnamomi]|nr:hypothetical protein ON010_g8038 [Phytophthora cinnamomi]
MKTSAALVFVAVAVALTASTSNAVIRIMRSPPPAGGPDELTRSEGSCLGRNRGDECLLGWAVENEMLIGERSVLAQQGAGQPEPDIEEESLLGDKKRRFLADDGHGPLMMALADDSEARHDQKP